MQVTSASLIRSPRFWRLVLAATLAVVALTRHVEASQCGCTQACHCVVVEQPPTSWIFAPGRYTHDPATGARVAQYMRGPAVEPLDDPRAVTSGYSRSRTVMRGADGSVDTRYRVQSYGNGYGGLDAEWERAHDAYRGAPTFGGFGGFYPGYPGFPPYYGGPGRGGFAHPGFPGYGELPRRLDPDAADGFIEPDRRTPDRRFYRNTPWHDPGGNTGPGS